MALLLLDSCVVIDLLRGRDETVGAVEARVIEGDLLATCAVVQAEIAAGMREDEREATERLLDSLLFLPLSAQGARVAGAWRRDYRRRGVTLSLLDCLIAAAAFENAALLWTQNVSHYPQPQIRMVRTAPR